MPNDFGGTPQATYFADPGNVSPVPFNTELEIFVRIKTLWINGEFSHDGKPRDTKSHRFCQSFRTVASTGVACVPIDFARDVHYDRQHDKEGDCAH